MRLAWNRLDKVREKRPLIHCISNMVAANDCANLTLAAGASPVMADAPPEMLEITAASAATVLNTGTPNAETFRACRICGQEAERLGRPVTLDPVGVGASVWRRSCVLEMLEAFTPAILRVNLGEAQALAGLESVARGVDSPEASLAQRLDTAVRLSRQCQTTVLLSGTEDLVCGPGGVWCVRGGSAWMTQVTGTGCMLSILCGVFAAVEPDPETAALLASVFWKTCARRAETNTKGSGSFRAALLDTASMLTPEDLQSEAQIEKL